MRFGAGSENRTMLGVCNAAGAKLDPLIMFRGQNMQRSWYGDKILPNTWYGKSENCRLWLLVALNIVGNYIVTFFWLERLAYKMVYTKRHISKLLKGHSCILFLTFLKVLKINISCIKRFSYLHLDTNIF